MAQEKWLVASPKTIDIERARNLKVGLVGGQIDIVGHDEPGIRVEVHSVSGRDLLVSLNGDTLEIDHPQVRWDNWLDVFTPFNSNAKADVSVMVPREVALKFGTVSASGLISGLVGDASISTVSGEIVVDGLQGRLTMNSVGGELAVRNHIGKISARTVSGDVTASGDVSSFTHEGVSGNVFLDLGGVPDEVRVSTVSGAVTVRLDAGIPAAYTINKVAGRLQLDDSEIRNVHGRYEGRYGVLEKSWVDVRVNTVSGNVSVLHAVRA